MAMTLSPFTKRYLARLCRTCLLVLAIGGSAPKDGTFGWVLVALPDGIALMECKGPADGAADQMLSSGRGQSTGALSSWHVPPDHRLIH